MVVGRQLLHPHGPELSRLVWGAWRSVGSPETDTPAKLARLIDVCAELGITTFDHADIYGGYRAEAAFGAALREAPRFALAAVWLAAAANWTGGRDAAKASLALAWVFIYFAVRSFANISRFIRPFLLRTG